MSDPVSEPTATTTKPRPAEETHTRLLPPYHVVILNDDDHSFEFVVHVLRQVFGVTLERAFELTMEATSLGIGSVNADYGGKRVVPRGVISVKGSIPSNGTFKAYASSIPAHFSGSWNCHGVVWSHGE